MGTCAKEGGVDLKDLRKTGKACLAKVKSEFFKKKEALDEQEFADEEFLFTFEEKEGEDIQDTETRHRRKAFEKAMNTCFEEKGVDVDKVKATLKKCRKAISKKAYKSEERKEDHAAKRAVFNTCAKEGGLDMKDLRKTGKA